MNWKIETAQQHFLEIVSAAKQNPQLIYEHNHPVAAVIPAELFQAFLTWQSEQQDHSFAHAFTELRQLCVEEGYSFEMPIRCDRPNPFAEMST